MILYVSGGRHIHWDSAERREEIIQALDGEPEAVLVEGTNEPDDNKEKLLNLIAAPLVLLYLVSWGICLKILNRVFDTDQKLISSISDDPDIDKIKVDRPLTPIISEARSLWAISNWVILGIVLLIYLGAGLNNALSVLIILSTVIFLNFLAGTAAPRNYAMAINTMEVAKEHGYERVVLVVGDKHAEDVKQNIRRASDNIEIAEV